MKEKRGVSPLVATVLLVAIVIVIAFLIFWWYGDLIESKLEKEEYTADQACIQKASFSITTPICNDGPNVNEKLISFTPENTGSIRISSFRIIAEGDNGDAFSQELAQALDPGTSAKMSFIADISSYGTEYTVEVVPMIRAGGTTKHCTEKSSVFYVSC